MAKLKTQPSDASVEAFLQGIDNEKKQQDSYTLLTLMREVTGEEPQMWGDNIIGFGRYHYRYASGREGTWFLTGFSPRKQSLTLYIMSGFERYDALLAELGKYRTGKSCLYINKLEDVDLDKLKELVRQSMAQMAANST